MTDRLAERLAREAVERALARPFGPLAAHVPEVWREEFAAALRAFQAEAARVAREAADELHAEAGKHFAMPGERLLMFGVSELKRVADRIAAL
jgi:hypothetical protein